jgi:cardiolipin synthase
MSPGTREPAHRRAPPDGGSLTPDIANREALYNNQLKNGSPKSIQPARGDDTRMTILLIVVEFIGLAAIPHVLLSGKRSVSMLIWIGVIVLFPGLGLAAYLLIGNDRVRRRRQFRRHAHRHTDREGRPQATPDFTGLPPEDQRLLRAVSRLCSHPVAAVRKIRPYYSGKEYYPDLIAALDQAREFIHVEMYFWRNDDTGGKVLQALAAAARRGVEVRLLVDEIGSLEVRERFFAPLVEAGGRFSWFYTFHPRRNRYFFNHRNHRKLQIIDGRLAFVGGINIGDEYAGRNPSLGDWKDLHLLVEGDVVDQLHEVFRRDWYFATEEEIRLHPYGQPAGEEETGCPAVVVESGPDTNKGIALNSLLAAIGQATERLELFTPYFVPEPELVSALQIAAAKGVDVRLMVSRKNDFRVLVDIGRSFYDDLLASGIRIYEYTRAMHHAKLAVIDGRWILAGSANLDARSMNLNFEVGVLVRSTDLGRQLEAHFEGLFAEAVAIDPRRFARRSTYQRLRQGALRLWAPLL